MCSTRRLVRVEMLSSLSSLRWPDACRVCKLVRPVMVLMFGLSLMLREVMLVRWFMSPIRQKGVACRTCKFVRGDMSYVWPYTLR